MIMQTEPEQMLAYVTRKIDFEKGNFLEYAKLDWEISADDVHYASYETMLLASRLLTDLSKEVSQFASNNMIIGLGNNVEYCSYIVTNFC